MLLPLDHDLAYGVQYQSSEQDTLIRDLANANKADRNFGLYQPYYMPSGTQDTVSAFVQDAIGWHNLTITPSLRYDYITNKGVENLASKYNDPTKGHDYSQKSYSGFSPRLAAFYKLTHQTSLFANYSYSFRAPSVRELYSVSTGNASATSHNLKPEKVYAARAGVTTAFSNVFTRADKIQLRSSIFNTEVKDTIHRRMGMYYEKDETGYSVGGQDHYANINGFVIRGIELELYYDSPRIFGNLNFAIMTSKLDGTLRDPNGPDVPVGQVPPAEINMGLGYKLYEHGMRFGWQGKYAHKTGRTAWDIDPDHASLYYGIYRPTSGYMLNHLFWDWEPKQVDGLKLQVFVENLFDRQYTSYLSQGVPGMGRNVKLSAAMKL